MHAQAFGDLRADAVHRVQAGHRLLEDHADVAAAHGLHLGFRQRQQIQHLAAIAQQCRAAAHDAARRRAEQAHQSQRGDALAGAGLADDRQGFAGAYPERHPLDRIDRAAFAVEAHAEIVDGKDVRHRCTSSRGSSASRSPSPRKLKPVTAKVMTAPGRIASQGALVRYSCALFSMLPQLGVGGWMP